MSGIIRVLITPKREAAHEISQHHLRDVVDSIYVVAARLSDGPVGNGLEIIYKDPDPESWGVSDLHLKLEAFNFPRIDRDDVTNLEDSMEVFQRELYTEVRDALNGVRNGTHLTLGVEYGHFITRDLKITGP